MNTPVKLAPNATARLTMIAGNPCSIAEFALFLDQFEYIQDPGDEHRWFIDNANNHSAAELCEIVIEDLNQPVETIDVYGHDTDHFTNLNFLMQRAGWASCAVVCQSNDISAKMLARFVNVDVESEFTLPASSLDANEYPHQAKTSVAPPTLADHGSGAPQIAKPSHQSNAAANGNAVVHHEAEMTSNHRVRELTIELNGALEKLASSEDENAALRQRADSLQVQVRQLTKSLSEYRTAADEASPPPSDNHLLMRVIEEHLLPSIDISNAASSKVVADLRAAGYGFQLRLVRAA